MCRDRLCSASFCGYLLHVRSLPRLPTRPDSDRRDELSLLRQLLWADELAIADTMSLKGVRRVVAGGYAYLTPDNG